MKWFGNDIYGNNYLTSEWTVYIITNTESSKTNVPEQIMKPEKAWFLCAIETTLLVDPGEVDGQSTRVAVRVEVTTGSVSEGVKVVTPSETVK